MTLTFNFPDGVDIAAGSSVQVEPKIRRAAFGDGYIQRSGDGINSVRDVFTLMAKNVTPAQAETIQAFMRARRGYEAFFWTPTDESEPRKFICTKWDNELSDFGARTVKLTFEEVFDP